MMLFLVTLSVALGPPVSHPQEITAANGTSITVQGDDFDAHRLFFAPRRKIGSVWTYYAAARKSKSGGTRYMAVVTLSGMSGSGLDTGAIKAATFRGGRQSDISIGPVRSGGCLRGNCFFEQTANISLDKDRINQSHDVLEFKVLTSAGLEQIISIPRADFDALYATAQ